MQNVARWRPVPIRLLPLAGCAALLTVIASGAAVQPGGAPLNRTLTAVPGIRVGHHTLSERPTGCTVILVEGARFAKFIGWC
jgi:hypothetical protein